MREALAQGEIKLIAKYRVPAAVIDACVRLLALRGRVTQQLPY